MAAIGLQKPHFAPFAGDEPNDALPTYGDGIVLGKAVSAKMTVQTATGELYADDVLAESVSEFVSASLALETDDLEDDALVSALGVTKNEEDEIVYNINDVYPLGGLGYFKKLQRKSKIFYRAYFYPKCKASPVDDNGQTKANSVTFQTSTLNFTIYAANTGDWQITKTCQTAAEAIAWIREKLGVKQTSTGGETP